MGRHTHAMFAMTRKKTTRWFTPIAWSAGSAPENRCTILRRFSAGAVNNLQIGGALTRIIFSGVLLSKF